MNKVSRVIAIIMVLILSLGLVGCNTVEEATKSFDEMMTAFKSGEKEQIYEYYNFEEESKIIDDMVSDEFYSVVLSTLSKMDYKIKNTEKIDSSTVKFTIDLTTIDFSKVMDLYIGKIMEMVESSEYQANVGSMTKEEYQRRLTDKMVEMLESPDMTTMENQVVLTMNKINGTWHPGPEKDQFIKSVFSSLMDAVNSLV